MDEDATWYGSRPPPRPHCVRRGPSSPPPVKGRSGPPLFGPCLLWPRSSTSATAEILFDQWWIYQNYRVSDSLDAHQAAWIVTKRNTVSISHHDQFNSSKNCPVVERHCVHTKKSLLISSTAELVNITHHHRIPLWSRTKVYCYLKQSAAGDILKEYLTFKSFCSSKKVVSKNSRFANFGL